MTSSMLVYNDTILNFQYYIRNLHPKLPLSAKFLTDKFFPFWIIAKFVFSLYIKKWRHRIWSITTPIFSTIFKICAPNYLQVPNISKIGHYVSEILLNLCFHCFQNYDVIDFGLQRCHFEFLVPYLKSVSKNTSKCQILA